MAKPYALVNNCWTTLSVAFIHGTDDHLHCADGAVFPSGGGYFRVSDGDGDAANYAEYEYTAKDGADILGVATTSPLLLCTLGNVESGAAHTFAIGCKVQRIIAAEELATLVTGPASAVDGQLAVFDGTTGKVMKDGGTVPTTQRWRQWFGG
jgi:hypothetical protein